MTIIVNYIKLVKKGIENNFKKVVFFLFYKMKNNVIIYVACYIKGEMLKK